MENYGIYTASTTMVQSSQGIIISLTRTPTKYFIISEIISLTLEQID